MKPSEDAKKLLDAIVFVSPERLKGLLTLSEFDLEWLRSEIAKCYSDITNYSEANKGRANAARELGVKI